MTLKEQVIALVIEVYTNDQPISIRDGAKQVGIGHKKFREILVEHGIPRTPKGGQPRNLPIIDIAIDYILSEKSSTQLGKEHQVAPSTITRRLHNIHVQLRPPGGHRTK